jgi:hypothetical protein
MAILERPDRSAADFDYPEKLADRLAWFTRELGVGEGQILGLMGLHDDVGRPKEGFDWRPVVAAHEDKAWWAEAVLYDALALFDYDVQALRRRVRERAVQDFALPAPGGTAVPAKDLPADARDRRLLGLVAQGSPAALPALLAYLSFGAGSAA